MSDYEYTAVVAVRKHKATPNAHDRFCVCRVPDGHTVDNGTMVLYGTDNNGEHEKGVCVSDTLFVDGKTLDMITTITATLGTLPDIKAVISLEWLAHDRRDAIV